MLLSYYILAPHWWGTRIMYRHVNKIQNHVRSSENSFNNTKGAIIKRRIQRASKHNLKPSAYKSEIFAKAV